MSPCRKEVFTSDQEEHGHLLKRWEVASGKKASEELYARGEAADRPRGPQGRSDGDRAVPSLRVSQPTSYTWRDKVLSGAAEALSGPGASTEVTQLRERVAELERALGKKTLEGEILGNVFGRFQ
jgi:hypothetical protein